MNHPTIKYDSILIANRGEIACRILRTARSLGLRTIAVYSEADTNAPHVGLADEAILLGPSPVNESYLRQDRILEAARATNAGAIHPGYGFLSENADFAKACAVAGVIFVGPTPEAIDLMGDKAKAKRRMINAGVPCVPGYQGENQSDDALVDAASGIGFPILVKAAAGGGGRGMRFVASASDLRSAIKTARSEAINAFGSGDLILERAIPDPRHVEIQVFADTRGNVIHLGERDCSVQRRHQKVLEEAPCPIMTQALRTAMGDAAVKAARDIGYVGAGTVEFLLDENRNFYFLEMNTRLQVEHPVTELVTGLDLVAMQIRISQGEPLPLEQSDVPLDGHAIEARLYAEDPTQGFLPATGIIDYWRAVPDSQARTDAGITTGSAISPFYDPMVAKVIAHGVTREESRRKLIKALSDTALFGVKTNRKFLIEALKKQDFIDSKATTAFIASNFDQSALAVKPIQPKDAAIAAILLFKNACDHANALAASNVRALLNWTSASAIAVPFRFPAVENEVNVDVTPKGPDRYSVNVDGNEYEALLVSIRSHDAVFSINDERISVVFNYPESQAGRRVQFSSGADDYDMLNLNSVAASALEHAGAGIVTAPMHGMLVDIFVSKGQLVKKGERLAILEAMKMQHELVAEMDGAVSEIYAISGVQVVANATLMEITAENS